ncbi:MAG: type II secretion system F family protein [Nitrospirae bacterium]|nr:type II secretion system F family protein [Nitrospirota bacterium]
MQIVRYSGKGLLLNINTTVTFFSELSSLYSSGIPLTQSLTMLIKTIKSKEINTALVNAHAKIESGQKLAESLYSEGLLNTLHYNLIILGEQTGTLDVILKNIVKEAEERQSLYRSIISKLIYPSIMILTSIAIIPLPEAFKENGSYLRSAIVPMIILLMIVGGAYYIYKNYSEDDGFRRGWDRFIIRIPYIGGIIETLAWIRFCTAFSICIGSGLDIINTAELSCKSLGNRALESQTIYIKRAMILGKGLSAFLAEITSVPSIIIEMAEIGEHSGTLQESMGRAGTYLKDKVTHKLSVLNVVLPIVISLIIAGFIGYSVIKFYMGYFKMLNSY